MTNLETLAREYVKRCQDNQHAVHGIAEAYCIADFKAGYKARQQEIDELVAALEFECGGRCARGINPCNAREVLDKHGSAKK